MYFSREQIVAVGRCFSGAERLTERYFNLGRDAFSTNRYDVKTRFFLADHEVDDRAFAHLVRYEYRRPGWEDPTGDNDFFKICLQDGRILHAVERSASFVKLEPLMCYIAIHELIHVIRFSRGEADFDASLEEKVVEEEKVHEITRTILKPHADRDMNLVIDCFRSDYHVGDIFTGEEASGN
ncbi:MAG: hypothetical protein M0Q23_08900 [Syntrophales bacterium]|jgi:hypothetical protein|nr:hypothetical protein [Syntrophales bacterium]MCK9528737.1 hypothetical protein [Syntrophales bacterium]MDX9922972.1 hypothetical protein [Syntrophales bacterium]